MGTSPIGHAPKTTDHLLGQLDQPVQCRDAATPRRLHGANGLRSPAANEAEFNEALRRDAA